MGFKRERNDKDIHIVIKDQETDETMVAEIPSYECDEVQQTSRVELFRELQGWFIENIGRPKSKFVFLENYIPVTITGVGFFDFYHRQTGAPLNAREIHPVLSIELK